MWRRRDSLSCLPVPAAHTQLADDRPVRVWASSNEGPRKSRVKADCSLRQRTRRRFEEIHNTRGKQERDRYTAVAKVLTEFCYCVGGRCIAMRALSCFSSGACTDATS